MADDVCLSIRFVPEVAEKVAALVYGNRDDRRQKLRQMLGAVSVFVRSLGFEVTATGGATVCIRGSAARFTAAFNTMPPAEGWSATGFETVDQSALDGVARKLPGFIQDIALQRSFNGIASVGDWPPPAPGPGCLGLDVVVKILGADLLHSRSVDGARVSVMIFDSDFAFDHSFFVERESKCLQRAAVAIPEPPSDTPPSGHGTAMAALVLSIAPRAEVIGMKLRNGVLLEGLNAALDPTHGPRPDIMSISLTKDMCDRNTGTCWTQLPRDLEHVAAEINLAVANGIAVVVGAGNGDYGFPAAMKQVIAIGGVQVDPSNFENRAAWDGASAFRTVITSGDCKNRFVPDISALAGSDRGAYIVLPVPPGSAFEREFPLAAGAPAGSGWALFSGTSAATAQVAGVCALLLQGNRGLSPRDLRNLLCNTARGVGRGSASALSNLPNATGLSAAGVQDRAAGFGLVDAFEAWSRADDAAFRQAPAGH